MLLAVLLTLLAASPPQFRFREHTITDQLKSGYQVVPADINGDGKPDLVVVDQATSEIAWYENPGWERHVLITGVPRPINLDAFDIDGDGVPEIALLYEFDMDPAKSTGIVALLHHSGDVRQPWTLREIDRAPAAHRVRWMRLDLAPVLIMAPLAGASAKPPLYDAPAPLYLYRAPSWKRELIGDELHGVLHGIYPGDREVLTASFLGIRAFRPGPPGAWRSREIGRGAAEACPKCGSSDVAEGHAHGSRFIAAIEPWHGNQVAVYRESGGAWRREVVDSTLDDGHALVTGDLGGDGNDEIVAGFRGKGHSVYLYSLGDDNRWSRTAIDAGGMAAANCAIRDLNGDGRPDVVCIGASTHNLKWYENSPSGSR